MAYGRRSEPGVRAIGQDGSHGDGVAADAATSLFTSDGAAWGASGLAINGGTNLFRAVALISPDVIQGDASTKSSLKIDGASVTSAIDRSGDHDWFRITLTAGQSYAFTLNGAGGSPLSDPFIELRDSAGNLVAIDDDGGPGANSLMHFTATQSGTYYLDVQAYSTETGGYTVSAKHGPAQNPLDTLDLGFTFYTNNINIYFAHSGESYPITSGYTGIVNADWTAPEQAAVLDALATISAVANVSFTVVNSASSADFVYAHTDLNSATTGILAETWPSPTDAFLEFDTNAVGWDSQGLAAGGLGFATIIHETLHALGFDHPFYDGGDVQVMQGTLYDPFGDYGTFLMDQQVFTIMAYAFGWPAGPNGETPSYNYGYAATPMGLDVAYLQELYGANASTNAANNTYTLSDFTAHTGYTAIWDTGGTDAIVYNGSQNATIDLRTATLQSEIGGGGYVSYVSGVYGGFTIANGVTIEDAYGGSGNDVITGNGANNYIRGGEGNDTLYGNGGADTLIGDGGSDTLYGGAGDDAFFVDNAGDRVFENASEGTDTVYSATTFTLGANLENLTLTGTDAINGTGTASANILVGNDGANVLTGLAGDDVYYVGAGDSVVEAAKGGTDTVRASASYTLGLNIENLILIGSDAINGTGNAAINTLTGNSNDNVLDGQAGNDILNGGAGNDALYGGVGNDTLNGEGGNDYLDGGAGKDTLAGGLGDDVYIFDKSDIIKENAGEGTDTIQTALAYTLLANFENLTLTGSAAIAGTGNGANNIIIGNSGDNILKGLGGDDILNGAGGNDTVTYASATGGVSVDLSVSGTQAIGGGEGSDTLISIERILGSNFSDHLVGDANANALTGGSGDDYLDGGLGADTLTGNGGNDTYVIDSLSDVISEGSKAGGVDTVIASISFTLATGFENLTLSGVDAINAAGNKVANVLIGNSEANVLDGQAGNDTLSGGAGDDTLIGGLGNDNLTGGAGADDFVFKAAASKTNLDVITDFETGIDHIKLENAIFKTIGAEGVLDASQFHIGAGATTASEHIIYNDVTGALYYDSNGSGSGGLVQIAILSAHPSLTSADFLVF